jgi:hypothetical protein
MVFDMTVLTTSTSGMDKMALVLARSMELLHYHIHHMDRFQGTLLWSFQKHSLG